MPLDIIKTLDKVNCLDAHIVEEQNGVAAINIKESCDNATYIGTNFYNALHSSDHSKTFDGGLQNFTMCVNKIELAFVFGKLLCLMMCLKLHNVVLTNKTQHGNQACLKLQQVEMGALEVGRNECSGKILLQDVLRGFMSREQT
jgi:hypothetical protein